MKHGDMVVGHGGLMNMGINACGRYAYGWAYSCIGA